MATRGRPEGGDKFAKAKLSFEKRTKVNKDAKITKIEVTPEDDRLYRCSCCGKDYTHQRNNFAMSSSPLYKGNNGYVNICKPCTDKYYIQLVDYYSGNEEKAIERCCQVFDWYYSNEVVAMTQKSMSVGKTRIGMYPSKMNMSQIKGETYLDTIADRASKNISSVDEVATLEEIGTMDVEELKANIKFFGGGYKPEEYMFLKNEYEDWISRYEAKTKAQEELFKNLCIIQLSIQQAKQRDDNKAVTDGMKTFQDLLGSASLKPNQNNDNALVEQNTFGTLIKKWEDEKPIPEPGEEFKDVDNIIKYISAFFNGHLAKMMGIDNDFSKLYDEEVGKYTVAPPEYVDDDEVYNDGNTRY